MKQMTLITGILVFVFSLAFIPKVQAANPPQGITQGEFALWLVKEAGAIRQLPTAASAQDAIDFLRKLGVVPNEGWKKDEKVNEAFLKSFFDDSETAGKDFDSLVNLIRDLVESRFSNANPAVFRVQSASGTTPA